MTTRFKVLVAIVLLLEVAVINRAVIERGIPARWSRPAPPARISFQCDDARKVLLEMRQFRKAKAAGDVDRALIWARAFDKDFPRLDPQCRALLEDK